MAPIATFLPLLLAGLTAARQCTNLSIPVDVESRQGVFSKVPIEGNLDVNAFVTKVLEYGANYTATLLQGYQTLKGSYHISAQYCKPDNGSNEIIQLLTHGIGFDKTYWDLSYNNYNYSYVNTALSAGYSTLAIDRLGIGNSSHGDPFNEIQAQAEVEALNAVTTRLRAGTIPEIDTAYKKVIHVGHSFGSVQSYWLSAKYPNNTDGVVLTGYSIAPQFLPYVIAGWNLHSARLNQPLRFGNSSNIEIRRLANKYGLVKNLISTLQPLLTNAGVTLSSQDLWNEIATTEVLDLVTGFNQTVVPLDYPSGYIVPSDLTALQFAFLYPNNYDVALAVSSETTKQPVTVGELLTIGSAPLAAVGFKGPALVFTGEHDIPFCGGNCYAPLTNTTTSSILAAAQVAFPNASAFGAYVQPDAGHGLTFHYNATAGYEVIQTWLASNGLAAK